MANKKTKTEAKVAKVAPEAVSDVVTPGAEVAGQTTMEPIQLTISDLQVLSRIVDLASRRGAFQAGELSQVGEAFNKLTNFLAYVESVQKKEAEDAPGMPVVEELAA